MAGAKSNQPGWQITGASSSVTGYHEGDVIQGPKHNVVGMAGGESKVAIAAGNISGGVGVKNTHYHGSTSMTGCTGVTTIGHVSDGMVNLNIGHNEQTPQQTKQNGNESCARPDIGSFEFKNENTVALMVAGKAGQADGNLFVNDVMDMKNLLAKHYGIGKNNIYKVTPEDGRNQKRNIKRALEDIKEDLEKIHDGYFIFFYAGHFGRQMFWTEGDCFVDKDLKATLESLPAKKMLFILDTCYSGGADLGARSIEEGEDPFEMPSLWDIFDWGRGESDDRQALQWCSCSSSQKSRNHPNGRNGLFTEAVLRTMEQVSPGTRSSVLEFQKIIRPQIKRQTATLKPDWAVTESDAYFAKFPKFIKY